MHFWAQGYQRVEGVAVQTGSSRIGHAAAAVVRTRPREETISLQGALPLAVNNKENGLIHRLSEASPRRVINAAPSVAGERGALRRTSGSATHACGRLSVSL